MDPCDEIRAARNVGTVRCGSGRALLTPDEVAREFGLTPIKFAEIDIRAARRLAQNVLHADLVHAAEIMPESKARELSRNFLALFGPKARFFTNGNFHQTPASHDKSGFTWTPATAATFDTGLLVVSDVRCGCLWVEDED